MYTLVMFTVALAAGADPATPQLLQPVSALLTVQPANGGEAPPAGSIWTQPLDAAAPTPPPADASPKPSGLPGPLMSPPLPSADFQGGPLIGNPPDTTRYLLMKALQGNFYGDALDSNRIRAYGWVDVSYNASTSRNSNVPLAYNVAPNALELDQFLFRLERQPDTAQTSSIDWGFRVDNLYGIDYRYTTGKGYFSEQLLNHNRLYGDDPVEFYGEIYVPGIAQGMILKIGRFISPPDIEAELAPDNYLFTHSIMYAYDPYTQTGLLATVKLDEQWHVQIGINGGDDTSPFNDAATPTLFLGARWVSIDNRDSVYGCVNSLNDGLFRGNHDNLQDLVATWTHRFNDRIVTATEAYYMWQRNAQKGGTENDGPFQYGGGGGPGPIIPGVANEFAVLNYTMFVLSKNDYITVRNEVFDDLYGQRTGFKTVYTTNTVGITHFFTPSIAFRPEVDYAHAYNAPAFDNGTRKNQVTFSADVILRF